MAEKLRSASMKAAPVLYHNIEKSNCGFAYILPQNIMDAVFNVIDGKNGNAIKLLVLFLGTIGNGTFHIGETYVRKRTGMSKRNYYRARNSLIEMGFLTKTDRAITVHVDKILELYEEQGCHDDTVEDEEYEEQLDDNGCHDDTLDNEDRCRDDTLYRCHDDTPNRYIIGGVTTPSTTDRCHDDTLVGVVTTPYGCHDDTLYRCHDDTPNREENRKSENREGNREDTRAGAYPNVAIATPTNAAEAAPPPTSSSLISEVASLPDEVTLKIFNLWSGNKIKIKDIVNSIESEDGLIVSFDVVNKIIDKYKSDKDSLNKLQNSVESKKDKAVQKTKISFRDKKHYDDLNRVKEIFYLIDDNCVNSTVTVNTLTEWYNDSYEYAKTQPNCKYDFTVDQMLKFLNDYLRRNDGSKITDIISLKKLWSENRGSWV